MFIANSSMPITANTFCITLDLASLNFVSTISLKIFPPSKRNGNGKRFINPMLKFRRNIQDSAPFIGVKIFMLIGEL